MTQRQVSHPAEELPSCVPECGRVPKHYLDAIRKLSAGGGHQLECSFCDRRTTKHATFDGALTEWKRMTGLEPKVIGPSGAVPITRARERATTRAR